MKIAVVDYGMGNLHSVYKTLMRLQVKVEVSSDSGAIASADKIILPGVGNFGKAMQNIRQLNLFDTLNEMALIKKSPILGICLGMQLMAQQSEEGCGEGFGWFDARVVRFPIVDKTRFGVPHMGWNTVAITKENRLLQGIDPLAEFYFVHSYHMVANHENDVIGTTVYESEFCSAIGREHIFGVQFHPEKSHDAGRHLLKNFIKL